jgi:hypothetical protein
MAVGILGSILGGVGGFLLGGPAGAAAGASLFGGVDSANASADAANAAAGAQTAASQAAIAEQKRQFDAIRALLQPYVDTGSGSLSAQRDLIGLGSPGAQQSAIQAIQQGPQFQSLLAQGENSILQNASATGGLRGGNTQAALAQFSPALLSQLISQQYDRLGGLSSIGQNAAAGVGNAGMSSATSIGNLLQQQGAAQAGGLLAQGRASAAIPAALASGLGIYTGLGGRFGTPSSGLPEWAWTGLPSGTF